MTPEVLKTVPERAFFSCFLHPFGGKQVLVFQCMHLVLLSTQIKHFFLLVFCITMGLTVSIPSKLKYVYKKTFFT